MYDTEVIIEAMYVQRLTNEQLAERSGVSYATVSAIRNGRTGINLESLAKIAKALNIPLSELFKPAPTDGQSETVAA
jgi:transcriptional regulator with XRE-family HTH domain